MESKALRYNSGKPRYSLLDLECLQHCAHVLEYGADKYTVYVDPEGNQIKKNDVPKDHNYNILVDGRDNWKQGLKKSEVIDSLLRHLTAIRNGEEFDEESKLPHIGHLQCNAMFLGSKNLINDI